MTHRSEICVTGFFPKDYKFCGLRHSLELGSVRKNDKDFLIAVCGDLVACAGQTPADTESEEQVRAASQQEVHAFLNRDSSLMARLWSDDIVVPNPMNKFHQKAGSRDVQSGFLIITSYDRRTEYARVYRDTVILAGSETMT